MIIRESNRAAKCLTSRLRTRLANRDGYIARACWNGSNGDGRAVLEIDFLQECGDCKSRVNNVESSAHHGRPLARHIPGETKPRRKVFGIRLVQGTTQLALLDQPLSRAEAAELTVGLFER